MLRIALALTISVLLTSIAACSNAPAPAPDGSAGMCTPPGVTHCCCRGDLVDRPVCRDDGRWSCEVGTYHTGAECGFACGGPCSLPCPPDAGPRHDAGDRDAGDRDAGASDAGASDAGQPDAGSDAGMAIEGVACDETPPRFPVFARACVAPADCFVVEHQIDCCGSHLATGVSTDVVGDFGRAEALCRAQYPRCRCAARPTVADDGSVTMGVPATVDCVAGTCTTSFPAP